MNQGKTAYFRFYEELNDFLPPEKRKVKFPHLFRYKVSVKDMIESIGVPHAEVDMILANGISVSFSYIVNDKDEISVYPVFESFDISDIQHLRAKPLRVPRFVLDVHLGSLAKYMRMAGLDTEYGNNFSDEDIVKISLNERRAILTKDVGLLKRNEVTHGYFVRSSGPEDQLKEIIERFHLQKEIKEFTRCLICNSLIREIDKNSIIDRLPEKVKNYHKDFYICSRCNKIYWKGTHFDNMSKTIHRILES
ncbi:MAG: Mut7-C RNAse domain-containing protein [Ignavibacteriaceae bacterium]